MIPPIHITLALAFSLFFSACASFDEGKPQQVVVVSFPTEASVYIDGNATGITPLTINLPRKLSHEIRLEKEGYNPAVKYFTPVPNDKNQNFVRFGLAQDLGYYHDLEPGVMEAKMKSVLVPNSTGADPFQRMAQQALEADRQLQAGVVTPLEHKYIIEQILEFFEQKN
jgi:hypothetical protein